LVDTERTAVAVTREWLASRGHRERAPWEECTAPDFLDRLLVLITPRPAPQENPV
jgi:hypothetical protein